MTCSDVELQINSIDRDFAGSNFLILNTGHPILDKTVNRKIWNLDIRKPYDSEHRIFKIEWFIQNQILLTNYWEKENVGRNQKED